MNDILSCWTYCILNICLVLLFQILWMYFSSYVLIFKVWLKIKSLWIRGFCVCTQNKILYFQHSKFHWVENLWESFNTLDRRATIFSNKHFCRFYACIQNQIIHKHVHVNYDPLKGMLVLISCQLYSIQLVQKVEVTQGQYIAIYRYQTASQVSLFVGFLIFMDQPTHENHENWYSTNKSDFISMPN